MVAPTMFLSGMSLMTDTSILINGPFSYTDSVRRNSKPGLPQLVTGLSKAVKIPHDQRTTENTDVCPSNPERSKSRPSNRLVWGEWAEGPSSKGARRASH